MRERIVEIIVYLMSELRNDIPLNEIDLSVLTSHGYSPTEISTAFTWLYDKINTGEKMVSHVSASSPHSFRVLHDAERMVLSSEAYGYLIQLREIGLIAESDIESIIDRVMLAGYPVAGLAEVKSITAAVLLDNDDSYNTGSRIMLNNNDTVN
jgi:Smg protein